MQKNIIKRRLSTISLHTQWPISSHYSVAHAIDAVVAVACSQHDTEFNIYLFSLHSYNNNILRGLDWHCFLNENICLTLAVHCAKSALVCVSLDSVRNEAKWNEKKRHAMHLSNEYSTFMICCRYNCEFGHCIRFKRSHNDVHLSS